jgi:hypothetical protein
MQIRPTQKDARTKAVKKCPVGSVETIFLSDFDAASMEIVLWFTHHTNQLVWHDCAQSKDVLEPATILWCPFSIGQTALLRPIRRRIEVLCILLPSAISVIDRERRNRRSKGEEQWTCIL